MKKTQANEPANHYRTPSFPSLFGVLFIVLLGLIFINSGIFAVKDVVIKGNEVVPTEDIALLAHLNNCKNMFQVDVNRIKAAILQNPKIAKVNVKLIYPHQILISVRERQPLCLLLYLDNLLIIGDDLVIMGVKDENEPISLPIVTGIKLSKMIVGRRVNHSNFILASEILKAMDVNLRQNISELNMNNYQLYIDLPNAHHTLKVELGTADQMEKKIYNLSAIVSHTLPDELEKIDLRAPDLPTVIKLKPNSK